LTIADLENVSKYDASSSTTTVSVGYDSGGGGIRNTGIQIPGGSAVNLGASEDNTSTSLSGISAGTIIVGGKQITPNDDGQYIVNGQVLNTAVVTGGDSGHIDNSLDLKKINSEFAIGTALSQEMATGLSNLGKDYPDAFGSGTNGRLILTALAGAMEGNLSGSATDLLGSTAASVIQGLGAQGIKEILGDFDPNDPDPLKEGLRTAFQSILGCAAGAATGGNCGSGALGAAASVVMNDLVSLADGQSVSQLPQEEKDKITSLIASLTGNIAGALGGNAGVASLAARIESENNQQNGVYVGATVDVVGGGTVIYSHLSNSTAQYNMAQLIGDANPTLLAATVQGGAFYSPHDNVYDNYGNTEVANFYAGAGIFSLQGSIATTTLPDGSTFNTYSLGAAAGYSLSPIGGSQGHVLNTWIWPVNSIDPVQLNQLTSAGIGYRNSCMQTNTCGD